MRRRPGTTYIDVPDHRIKPCSRCEQPITFFQNRNGKWYPVDIHMVNGRACYRTGIGAYGNMTPWHRCPTPRDLERATEARKINQK